MAVCLLIAGLVLLQRDSKGGNSILVIVIHYVFLYLFTAVCLPVANNPLLQNAAHSA